MVSDIFKLSVSKSSSYSFVGKAGLLMAFSSVFSSFLVTKFEGCITGFLFSKGDGAKLGTDLGVFGLWSKSMGVKGPLLGGAGAGLSNSAPPGVRTEPLGVKTGVTGPPTEPGAGETRLGP